MYSVDCGDIGPWSGLSFVLWWEKKGSCGWKDPGR